MTGRAVLSELDLIEMIPPKTEIFENWPRKKSRVRILAQDALLISLPEHDRRK